MDDEISSGSEDSQDLEQRLQQAKEQYINFQGGQKKLLINTHDKPRIRPSIIDRAAIKRLVCSTPYAGKNNPEFPLKNGSISPIVTFDREVFTTSEERKSSGSPVYKKLEPELQDEFKDFDQVLLSSAIMDREDTLGNLHDHSKRSAIPRPVNKSQRSALNTPNKSMSRGLKKITTKDRRYQSNTSLHSEASSKLNKSLNINNVIERLKTSIAQKINLSKQEHELTIQPEKSRTNLSSQPKGQALKTIIKTRNGSFEQFWAKLCSNYITLPHLAVLNSPDGPWRPNISNDYPNYITRQDLSKNISESPFKNASNATVNKKGLPRVSTRRVFNNRKKTLNLTKRKSLRHHVDVVENMINEIETSFGSVSKATAKTPGKTPVNKSKIQIHSNITVNRKKHSKSAVKQLHFNESKAGPSKTASPKKNTPRKRMSPSLIQIPDEESSDDQESQSIIGSAMVYNNSTGVKSTVPTTDGKKNKSPKVGNTKKPEKRGNSSKIASPKKNTPRKRMSSRLMHMPDEESSDDQEPQTIILSAMVHNNCSGVKSSIPITDAKKNKSPKVGNTKKPEKRSNSSKVASPKKNTTRRRMSSSLMQMPDDESSDGQELQSIFENAIIPTNDHSEKSVVAPTDGKKNKTPKVIKANKHEVKANSSTSVSPKKNASRKRMSSPLMPMSNGENSDNQEFNPIVKRVMVHKDDSVHKSTVKITNDTKETTSKVRNTKKPKKSRPRSPAVDSISSVNPIDGGGVRKSSRKHTAPKSRTAVGTFILKSEREVKSVNSANIISRQDVSLQRTLTNRQTSLSSSKKRSFKTKSRTTSTTVRTVSPIREIDDEPSSGFRDGSIMTRSRTLHQQSIVSSEKTKRLSDGEEKRRNKKIKLCLEEIPNHTNLKYYSKKTNDTVDVVVNNMVHRLQYIWYSSEMLFETLDETPDASLALRLTDPLNKTCVAVLKLEPKGLKPKKVAKEYPLSFFVLEGEGKVHLEKNSGYVFPEKRIGERDEFVVQKGYQYSIENLSDTQPLLMSVIIGLVPSDN